MSRIPINNLYYLLSYAWDLLSERDAAPIAMDETRSAPDMLAKMLCSGIESLGRRGLFRDYQTRREDTSRLKGRIDFLGSVNQLHYRRPSLVCEFDELDTDNLANGILRSTVDRLLASQSIDQAIKHQLWNAAVILQHVPPAPLQRGCFRRARVSRHLKSYRMALLVCELLFETAQPDSSGKSHRFIDPWANDGMPKLFETFVRNFYRQHLPDANVTARQFVWEARGDTAEAHSLLPLMKTDVTIEWGQERCVILDCKFYSNSFTEYFEKEKLKSANLYQIAAYLHHHPLRKRGASMNGILLYPTVDADFLHQYDFMGHRLTIASVNLTQKWQIIHERLLEVIYACTEQRQEHRAAEVNREIGNSVLQPITSVAQTLHPNSL
jgi:5-methylcytosine-specific restriction enzyme subunit McrC